jgi:5-methyltetrahydropteroyltriglutamate--homocysteine methyltransferase
VPHAPVLTTVIGSYPFPGWLELCGQYPAELGPDDLGEALNDAVAVAIQDQVRAGLDVITDGEQGRFDFNLSFYAFLEGIDPQSQPGRLLGPPAHDQRGRHAVIGPLSAPRGLGVARELERLQALAPVGPVLKAAVPGPYTLAGRVVPGGDYPDRWAVAEALLPIVQDELGRLVDAGCSSVQVDEPSMSCYADREDTVRLVDLFNRTVAPVVGHTYLSTHLCFGNYKGRAVGRRSYAPMFPDFLGLDVDELHLEMASRELSEIELIAEVVAAGKDVAVGIVDVKSYYIETPEDIVARIRRCLELVPAERLAVAPDCGLSQTARWAAAAKLVAMVEGARRVRETL